MASYPASVYSPRAKENRNGVVYDAAKKSVIFCEDIQNSDAEIVAIETELGANPKGVFESVAAYLADLASKVISVFTDLTDVPQSYEDQAGKYLKVKATEDGLEFGVGGGGGDMYKSTYDTDDDGIVDNSGKLEGSTKAEVQTHAPQAHHLTHENGGGDEISVAGLSGELADNQPPKTHKATHENGGGDEISVAGLSGELADPQRPKPTVLTLMPKLVRGSLSRTSHQYADNNHAHLGLVVVPFRITINKITFRSGGVQSGNTIDIAMYSEDGATRYFNVTSAAVSATWTYYTITLGAPVTLEPGLYWIGSAINTAPGTIPEFMVYTCTVDDDTFAVASEPVLEGTIVITAGTLPTTITPSSITFGKENTLALRLDN